MAKERRLRNHYKCITITGQKLNVEEFPDIPGSQSMNLERETSRRDEVEGWKAKMLTFVERPAARLRILSTGIQSHQITPWQFISCCRQQEENGRCMFGLLYLAPENFSISLSCCYNYTQNFTKGTYQAGRHHENKSINACISLLKAPDTTPIKAQVINVH